MHSHYLAYAFVFLPFQMGAVESGFDEVQNLFDIGDAKGLSGASVAKIPQVTITGNNGDASGQRDSCSVCLQVCLGCSFCNTCDICIP